MINKSNKNKVMEKSFKILVETETQADKLLKKFDRINAPASAKKTPNGKYIVTFTISVK